MQVLQRVEPIHEKQTGFSLFFSYYQLSHFLWHSHIEMRFHIKKNQFKGTPKHTYKIHAAYRYYSHKVLYKLIVSTHFYLMVCVRIVTDARCKTKTWDTLISQKRSVPVEVFLSL